MIGDQEIEEVVDSLRAGWVTTGPKVKRFEEDFARYVGAKHAVAVNSCTAALHLALEALGVGEGDEVIVPTLTFCATANVVVHAGARPVLVDVGEDFQISVAAIERAITPKTHAIIPVHYAGQACALDEILALASRHGIDVIEDAAHAVGTQYHGRRIGSHGRAVCFSFYATKNITTGEGGMVATDDAELASRMRTLSLHGMSHDAWKRYTNSGSWYYEVLDAGFKYNMTDIQAALGIHQLRRLDQFITRRREIAREYTQAFEEIHELQLPQELPGRPHTFHLYPVRLKDDMSPLDRDWVIAELKAANIGASVHFVPLHRHPFYRDEYGYAPEHFPTAEKVYRGLLSLPLYPKMTDSDVQDVIHAVRGIVLARRATTNHGPGAGTARVTYQNEAH